MAYNKFCTVLVNSCDRYQEAWNPFFSLFRKFWKECPFEVVLATETYNYSDFNVRTINTGNGVWSKRLNTVLRKIDTPYVLFFLEDYFLHAPVRHEAFMEVLNKMIKDENVGAFYFNRIGGYRTPSIKYPDFYDMNNSEIIQYHLNCQVGLWSRMAFIEATNIDLSPWEFEMEGFGKVSDQLKNYSFYCSKDTVHYELKAADIFSYLVSVQTGIGIARSKWLWNNKKFFKSHGIDCKCETLGHMSHFEFLFNEFKAKLIRWIRF